MKHKLVSIIIPLYNGSSFISDTIKSVQEQTFKDWEMIIVDDCSTDGSAAVVRTFLDHDPRIKLITLNLNSGAAVARNKAIELAEGRYIAFLDSDDLWLPQKLEKQLAFMKANDYSFVFSAYDKIDQEGHVFGRVGVPDKVSYADLLKIPSIGCLTAIYDTDYFETVYMPLIRKRQDLGLWLKLLKKANYAYGLNESLAQYRVRTDSISANKANAAMFTWLLYREVEGLSLIKSCYYFSHYAVNSLLRTKLPALARVLGVLN